MDTTIWFVRNFLFEIMTGNLCGQDLAAIGNHTSPCGYPIVISTGIGNKQISWTNEVKVYPNPSNEIIFIEKPVSITSGIKVNVYDATGRLVRIYDNITDNLTIKKVETGTGLFIVTIQSKNNPTEMTKTKIIFE
jgi:hypothetical protein